MNLFKKSLLAKLLGLIISITVIGWGVFISAVVKQEEDLFQEKVKAVALMSQPLLYSLYKDMMEERPDMARYLMEGIKETSSVERVQVLRDNGREAGFLDLKTLLEVEEEYKKLDEEIPAEWFDDHEEREDVTAEGIEHPKFEEALERFIDGQKESVHYIETVGDKQFLTYLEPVLKKKCDACHVEHGEKIRGVLMISTSLDEMYAGLDASKRKWMLYGSSIPLGICATLSLMVKSVITRPIQGAAALLKDIEAEGDLTKRLQVRSKDEVGQMALSFNKMMGRLRDLLIRVREEGLKINHSSSEIKSGTGQQAAGAAEQSSTVTEVSTTIEALSRTAGHIAETAQALSSTAGGARRGRTAVFCLG